MKVKQLSQIGKYKDAISKLSIAESKWSPEAVKIEIATAINKNKELAESSDNFEQGKIQYDGENYTKAIEYFDKVIINDDNYKTAQSYREISEKKINNEIEIKEKIYLTPQVVPMVQSSLPTIDPTKSIDNLIALCKSDKENIMASLKVSWNNKAFEIAKQANGQAFLNSWGSSLKTLLFAKIEQISLQRETYCLEHNRDYSEYVMPPLDIPSP